MIPLEAFFSHVQKDCNELNEETKDYLNKTKITYLHGPISSGGASLLLQCGYYCIKDEMECKNHEKKELSTAILILHTSILNTTSQGSTVPIKPCLKCHLPLQTGKDTLIWQQIQVKYMTNVSDIQTFVCNLQLLQSKERPNLILIDQFELFITSNIAQEQGNGLLYTLETEVYQTMAYLYEGLKYLQEINAEHTVGIVLSGYNGSIILKDRWRLTRWCEFIEILKDKDKEQEFILHKEIVEPCTDNGDIVNIHAKEGVNGRNEGLRYIFVPPDATFEGLFRRIHDNI